MNYVMCYDFDNFDSLYECIPAVRNGVSFGMFDCIVKFYTMNENQVTFWVNGSNHTKKEAETIFAKVSKLLSYLFALPMYSKENRHFEVDWCLQTNNILSKKSMNTISLVEESVNKFSKTSTYFEENLDLLIVAIDNLFKYRKEDAFVYFFKVIERIAKQYYVVYIQRHHTKAVTSKNKSELKSMLKNYALNNLYVELTEDILNRKVDLFYKEIKKEFYGSIFNKISLFVTKEEVDISMDTISKIVMQLKHILSGKGKEKEKPTTAQKTITFEKMFRDGICQVSHRYYTKMVEFFDINYELLEVDDQADILAQYSKLINYFDPSVKFELVLFNRQVNEQTLTEQFDIPWQEDDFNDIREEYTEMLKKQAAKGNNGIIKSKYWVFGVESNGYKEAKSRLNNIEKDVIRNLNNIGTLARGLDGKERLRILHEYFNQDTMEPFRFSFKDLAESGKSVKDYIAPPGFDFRYPNRFKSGNMYGCVSYLDIIAPKFTDELIKQLLDIDANLTISMHMQTEDPVKAIKKLKAVISNIQKMKIEEQKKAVRSGYDMDILPTDIVTYEKDTLEFLDDLNTSNQKMINMTFLITCYGRTKRELESLMQRVSGIIQQANCDLRCLQYLQEQGLMASAPIGCNETGIERTLSTKSTAILVPFCTQELFMPAPAIYYGLNALSNNMIMADRKRLRTPNGVILGTPGSGKSFSAKREILSCFLITKDDIIICDPEGEYFALVAALHGQVVKLATNSKDYLNPMDIQLSHKGDKEALKLKSDFIITLCDLIAGGKDGLENDEKGIIDECIRHIYDKYFENPVPENMPILEDLYNALLKHKNPKAERIANSLVLYVHGSQNYFNHHTNVDSGNRIMCFDIRDLGNQLKELGMLIVQDAVWNRVSQNRERKIATRYYCDEFHLLLKEKQTAIYSVEIWKRFRKWGGIPTGLTQNVGDFLRSEEIEGILGNSDFVYLLNQNAKDQAILADKLGLSDKQLSYVTNSEPGSGLILFDNVVIPFVDKYPTDTKTYRIMNTKPEESVQKEDAV